MRFVNRLSGSSRPQVRQENTFCTAKKVDFPTALLMVRFLGKKRAD
jgi:hypothetical protein